MSRLDAAKLAPCRRSANLERDRSRGRYVAAVAEAPGPPMGGRLTDQISLAVLTAAFSRDLIEEVVAATGAREKRSRLLPAHVMVRYVIGLGLLFGHAYEDVMRQLAGTL